MDGAKRARGHVGWAPVLVIALTTAAVGTLGSADAAVPVAAALVSAGAVAAVMVGVLTGLEHRDQHPYPLATLLWRLSPLPIAAGLALVLWVMPRSEPGLSDRDQGDRRQELDGAEAPEPWQDEAGSLEIAMGVLAALAVALLVVLLVRYWRRRPRRSAPPGRPGVVAVGDDPESAALRAAAERERRRAVREGLARGRAALLAEDDPRLAVVRAYLTFESHVRSRGFAREPTETQREFVSRVLAVGQVGPSSHARPLVDLFNVARFSDLPMTPADAQAAREHLDAMVGG